MAKVGRMVKETSVQEIATNLSERPNFFITAVNRLPAAETDAFRQKLFASQARLLMIKRTLGLRAFEPLKISGLVSSACGNPSPSTSMRPPISWRVSLALQPMDARDFSSSPTRGNPTSPKLPRTRTTR